MKMKITIKLTTKESIIKFEADQFLVPNGNFEFNNIDDAKTSPLAQELFYLPFVKKVYIASNFIAIERYDIVEWKDVQNEVAEQIEAYLNSGKAIMTIGNSVIKTPVTVYAESTPNPSVLKFVANKKLVIQNIEFNSIDDTKFAPMALALFQFRFVKSVFLDDNFVSITKYDIAEWSDITLELREFIKHFLESGKTVVEDAAYKNEIKAQVRIDKEKNSTLHLDATSKQIIDILEEYIKPAVASDGGNIEFQSYNPITKRVNVILQGACSGCPSSTFTLKNGIETMLKEMLNDDVLTVEAING